MATRLMHTDRWSNGPGPLHRGRPASERSQTPARFVRSHSASLVRFSGQFLVLSEPCSKEADTLLARPHEVLSGPSPRRGPGTYGTTDLFIRPGFEFRVVDALVTNFHLPGTSLLLLVAAFAGEKQLLTAYQEAVRRRYRFYSYGDAMLIA